MLQLIAWLAVGCAVPRFPTRHCEAV